MKLHFRKFLPRKNGGKPTRWIPMFSIDKSDNPNFKYRGYSFHWLRFIIWINEP